MYGIPVGWIVVIGIIVVLGIGIMVGDSIELHQLSKREKDDRNRL